MLGWFHRAGHASMELDKTMRSLVFRALITVAAFTGAFFAFQSAWYGYSLVRPLLYWDQIASIDEYLVWLDGNFSWRLLVRFHNEHRIATSRILYLIDAIHFDMTNRFLIATTYCLMLALTASIVALTVVRRTPSRIVIGTIAALGLGWSIAQHQNFSWGFQTQFPLVHIFALASLVSMTQMLDEDNHQARWFSLALVTDILGMLSFASGIFIGLCIVPIAICRRSLNRLALAFLSTHLAIVCLYLIGLPKGPVYPTPSAFDYLRYFLRTLGAAAQTNHAMLLGTVMLATMVGATSLSLWKVAYRQQPVEKAETILLSFAAFIIMGAVATTAGRAGMGLEQAIVSRYATPSALLLLGLLALLWRLELRYAKMATLLAMIGLTVLTNAPSNLAKWKTTIEQRDTLMIAVVNGDYSPQVLAQIYSDIALVERDYKLLEKLKKGPFAPTRPSTIDSHN